MILFAGSKLKIGKDFKVRMENLRSRPAALPRVTSMRERMQETLEGERNKSVRLLAQ